MARLTREKYLEQLQKIVGEDTSDETLALLDDFTDTYDELSTASTDQTNWQEKYEENDKTWRAKYRDRFFSAEETPPDNSHDEPEEETEVTINDLFTSVDK